MIIPSDLNVVANKVTRKIINRADVGAYFFAAAAKNHYLCFMIETELCAYGIDACRAAAAAGVTRVELCSSPADGGTTPSAAAIRLARRIPDLQLSVMIRPRGGDFLYTESEFAQMLEDVRFARECGADCIAAGCLTAEGHIDAERMERIAEAAGDMEITFHRAFDMCADPMAALDVLIRIGCRRILTSGQRDKAADGTDLLRQLVARAARRIDIMAGSGVNAGNARAIAAAGVDALHFSARRMCESAMTYRNADISMGGDRSVSEYGHIEADPLKIEAVMQILRTI